MRWTRYHKKPSNRWRVWFALLPTIVHQNDEFTDYVWLGRYKWRVKNGVTERQDYWSAADPYEVRHMHSGER